MEELGAPLAPECFYKPRFAKGFSAALAREEIEKARNRFDPATAGYGTDVKISANGPIWAK
jgi:hypothetical protein